MAYKLAEAFIELKAKGTKEAKEEMAKLVAEAKKVSGAVEHNEQAFKKYEDQIKKNAAAGKSFSDTVSGMGLKFETLAKGIAAATGALVLFDRAAQDASGFGGMIEDWTRKLVGFKSRAEEAAEIGNVLAAGSQLNAAFTKQRNRMMSGMESMTEAEAARFSSSGLTFGQEDVIENRLNAIDRQRRSIDTAISTITGKAKSGIFSGMEQLGVFDDKSAQQQLTNLRAQKNLLGELVNDTFEMERHMKEQNIIAADNADLERKMADAAKDREERAQRIKDYEKEMGALMNQRRAENKERLAAQRAGMNAVADVVSQDRRSSEFVALEDMARRAQAAAGGTDEKAAQKANIEAAKSLKRIVDEGVRMKEYPYAKMSR